MVKQKGILWIIGVIALLLLFGYVLATAIAVFLGRGIPTGGNIALIPIHGVILSTGASSPFGDAVASSTKIVEFIKQADKNPSVKAIIFDINSPGGSGVASDEIATAIRKTNKTTVSFIREVGASGAYWVASSTDYVLVNKLSYTGSIGVLASYLEFSGLLTDYNVTYQRLVAGKYKDIGTPWKKLTDEERNLIQEQLGDAHEIFIEEVAENRGLSVEVVRRLATGQPIMGYRAKELGLVDSIGGKDEAIRFVEEMYNITADVAEYKQKVTLLDMLASVFSQGFYRMGLGIGYGLKQEQPMYVWT
ncbi:MAG: signal peptide peptidase SppA [Candidatus Woesearchaeota archaeon]